MKQNKIIILMSILFCAWLCSCDKEEDNKKSGFDSDGASYAIFSVGANKQVRFSRGNLQYQASTATWRFAERQFDCIGDDNEEISISYSGWIDLFGWGTSSWKSGANVYQPYHVSSNDKDYYPGGSFQNDLAGYYAEADWAWHNAISNGGNKPHLWRTLAIEEWIYLFGNSGNRIGKWGLATIENMYHVLVILPDSWKTPNDLIWIPGMVSGWNTNTYSESQWFQMECAGAICLPASSTYSVYGEDVIVGPVGKEGCYWSVSHNDEKYAYGLYFDNETLYPYVDDWFRRSDGLSIRPVQDVK